LARDDRVEWRVADLTQEAKTVNDPLTYTQRLKLGAIRVRRDCADQARQQANQAALLNDYRACEMLHAEADQHEAAIVEAARALGEQAPRVFDLRSPLMLRAAGTR